MPEYESLEPQLKREGNTTELFSKICTGYYSEPVVDESLPQEIIFPEEWEKILKEVGSLTNQNGKERLVKIVFDTKLKVAELQSNPEWVDTGRFIGRKLFREVSRNNEYPKRSVGVGHSHPPLSFDPKSAAHYNHPNSSAFLSPGDIYSFLSNPEIPPFFFAFEENKLMMAVRSKGTRKVESSSEEFDLEEFWTQSRLSYEHTSHDKSEKSGGNLKNFFDSLKLVGKPINPNFNIVEWNTQMAKKYNFHLYYGDCSSLKKIC